MILLILNLCFFLGIGDKCDLKDGEYLVIYEEGYNMDVGHLLDRQEITVLSGKLKNVYPIEWISDNQFRFIGTGTENGGTGFENKLNSLGIPYYELSNCGNDTVNFVIMRNAHITIGSGKLILIK